MNALKLAELLCARICHDMSGPVGATAAGAELLQDLGGGDGEIVAMVASGAGGGAARLRFLRAALGPAASNPMDFAALRGLVDAQLLGQASATIGPAVADWVDFPAKLDGGQVRLLLNLALLGRDCLPRGGVMSFGLADGMPYVRLRGEPAALADEIRVMLTEKGAAPAGPRAAQAAFARLSAEELGAEIKVYSDERGLTLQVAAN